MKRVKRRQTVLIIDDDAIVRLMATEALSDAGYLVAEAPDAESGWERFVGGGVDLVLLDVILPGMNGFEACARLREHAAGANVPIIVMTGLDDQQSIASAYDSGATDFITKPIVWDLLPYRVRYALRASDAFQEALRSRALLSRSQSLANMGSWEWRRADDSLAWSDEMHRILGTTSGAVDAPASTSLLTHVHADDRLLVERALAGAMDHGVAFSIEFRIVRADGTVRRIFEQTSIEHLADDTIVAVHGIRRDITEQTEANERIRSLAFFDPLTGLANRSLFRNMVQHRLATGSGQPARCAILIVDIDRFKSINESFGQAAGDRFLREVAHRIQLCLREGDTLARLERDEFALILEGPIAREGVALGELEMWFDPGQIDRAIAEHVGDDHQRHHDQNASQTRDEPGHQIHGRTNRFRHAQALPDGQREHKDEDDHRWGLELHQRCKDEAHFVLFDRPCDAPRHMVLQHACLVRPRAQFPQDIDVPLDRGAEIAGLTGSG